MRIYEEGSREKLSAVICNQCGKRMKVENGMLPCGDSFFLFQPKGWPQVLV